MQESEKRCNAHPEQPIRVQQGALLSNQGPGNPLLAGNVAMLKVAILITWIMQIVILPGQEFARIAGPWVQACDWSVPGNAGLWLAGSGLRRGVTFILQELRSPGGLIVRFIAWILQKMRNVKRRWTKEIKYGAEKKELSNVTIANISKLRPPPLGSHHLAWPHWSRPNHQVVTRERQN